MWFGFGLFFYLLVDRCSCNSSSCQVAARINRPQRVQSESEDRTRKMGKRTQRGRSKAGSPKYLCMCIDKRFSLPDPIHCCEVNVDVGGESFRKIVSSVLGF